MASDHVRFSWLRDAQSSISLVCATGRLPAGDGRLWLPLHVGHELAHHRYADGLGMVERLANLGS